MVNKQLAFVDIETTGLDFEQHEIIEIGCVLATQQFENGKFTFQEKDSFEIKVQPEHIDQADPQALRINKYDPSRWVFAHTLPQAMKLFAERVGDSVMVAHNVAFDAKFLDKAFSKTGITNPMHYARLDTFSMAFIMLYREEDIYRYSLQMLCDYFGIKNTNAHTALADARATFAVYQKLMERLL